MLVQVGGRKEQEKGCTMIGGDKEIFDQIEPIFKDISVEKRIFVYR